MNEVSILFCDESVPTLVCVCGGKISHMLDMSVEEPGLLTFNHTHAETLPTYKQALFWPSPVPSQTRICVSILLVPSFSILEHAHNKHTQNTTQHVASLQRQVVSPPGHHAGEEVVKNVQSPSSPPWSALPLRRATDARIGGIEVEVLRRVERVAG